MSAPASVLVVDDEQDFRALLVRFLTRDGRFTIAGEADDGEQALEMLDDLDPDVLLLDLAMPELDGLQVLERLRGRSRPTVIVLSGFADVELRKSAMELGATGYIEKGAVFAQLADEIEGRL